MHIQERTYTTLTTCTKMTEEVDRRHGVNGNSSGNSVNEDASIQNPASNVPTGGRLKFFKDGKFILELVRGSAREGERAGWVSVPRKTFWPPTAAPPTPPAPPAQARLERAASLSVSDDNSSIQSSPWQRDHCWKQTNPRKNVSKELAMYYCRPNTLLNATIAAVGRLKRRRPYDVSAADGPSPPLANGLGADSPHPPDDDSRRRPDVDKDKYFHMKLKKPYQYFKLRAYKTTKPSIARGKLGPAIDRLRERVAALPVPVNAKLASCRQEHMMVSPRKRILRELERVSLEDQGGKRRARTAPTIPTSVAAQPTPAPAPGPSRPAERPLNGTGAPSRWDPPTKNVSSYSIHSLLSIPDEPAASPAPSSTANDTKRSPHLHGGAIKTECSSSVRSPHSHSGAIKTECSSSVRSPYSHSGAIKTECSSSVRSPHSHSGAIKTECPSSVRSPHSHSGAIKTECSSSVRSPHSHGGAIKTECSSSVRSPHSHSGAIKTECPSTVRSPHSHGGAIKTESPSSVRSPDLSPSPDSYRYRYGSLAVGSPASSTTPRDSPTPPYRTPYAPSPTSPYAGPPPRSGSRASPLCYAPAAGAGGPGPAYRTATSPRDEWREAGYAYGAYNPYLSAVYRGPAPLWMQYAMPPGPWAPLPHPLLTDRVLKDETTSDLPLNLSKH